MSAAEEKRLKVQLAFQRLAEVYEREKLERMEAELVAQKTKVLQATAKLELLETKWQALSVKRLR